ncbi:MAG: MDR family MFS transporter [Ilumatobacteraceae bacterium]
MSNLAPTPTPELSKKQIYTIFGGVMAGMFLSALDGTIINTALATIVGELGGVKSYAWVGTAYLLTQTASTPLFGKLSDLYGRRLLFQIAIISFVVGSLLCGISQTMWQLILSRGVQGIGGGGLFSLSFAIIGDVVAPRDRGRYVGFITSVFTVTSVIGPLIGGFIVDNTSWRWIFLINLPLGLIALAITDRALRLPFNRVQRKVDYFGAFLLVLSVASLILALAWASEENGWLHVSTLGLVLVAAIGAVVFVKWEMKAPEPIIPMSMFTIDVVRTVIPMMFLVGTVFYGTNAFLPLYLQSVTGVSPTNSGLLLTPLAVSVAFSATLIGRRTSKTGSYKVWPPFGTIMTLLALLVLTTLGPGDGYIVVAMIGSALIGFGLGALMPTGTLAVQNAVQPHEMGTASSLVLFMRSLGGVIGLAAYGALFNSRISGRIDESLIRRPTAIADLPSEQKTLALGVMTDAITIVFWAAVPVIFVAALIAFRVPARPLRSNSAMQPGESSTTSH